LKIKIIGKPIVIIQQVQILGDYPFLLENNLHMMRSKSTNQKTAHDAIEVNKPSDGAVGPWGYPWSTRKTCRLVEK